MTIAPDLIAVKARQQVTWASGDYGAVAALIHPISELLVTAADLSAGARVLDVATGSGNAAIAAARCGCIVTGVDYVPELLERGKARAAAERLPITFVTGDAERLAYADGSFDAVLSVVGVMFAPDQERAATELVRVCRPGGTVALASWTPQGFIGDLFRTVGRHVPPPAGCARRPSGATRAGSASCSARPSVNCGRYAGSSSSASAHPRSSPTSSGSTTGRR